MTFTLLLSCSRNVALSNQTKIRQYEKIAPLGSYERLSSLAQNCKAMRWKNSGRNFRYWSFEARAARGIPVTEDSSRAKDKSFDSLKGETLFGVVVESTEALNRVQIVELEILA